jgi:predicted small lipoprotein YifL
MMTHASFNRAFRLAVSCLALAVAGCGMKGPLRHPAPPPADAGLMAPPTVAPATRPAPAAHP